jgi:hypothetical protein
MIDGSCPTWLDLRGRSSGLPTVFRQADALKAADYSLVQTCFYDGFSQTISEKAEVLSRRRDL